MFDAARLYGIPEYQDVQRRMKELRVDLVKQLIAADTMEVKEYFHGMLDVVTQLLDLPNKLDFESKNAGTEEAYVARELTYDEQIEELGI